MISLNHMNKSSTRGILLSITLLFSITLATIPMMAYAEVNVKSFGLEEITILEVINDSDDTISTVRIWLGDDFNFVSFKTEKDWAGEKTPQGIIIFTTSKAIGPGESVKFGVKTDKVEPGINWKALDRNDRQLNIGKVLPFAISNGNTNTVPPPPPVPPVQNTVEPPPPSMSSESVFRIIPDKPNVGSSIRVTGDNFGISQEFDFYIDSEKLGSFETDENGGFMTTMKIPENQNADRVDFKIVDSEGEEKKISLRIGEVEDRTPVSPTTVSLTIEGIPSIIHRGDILDISGTGNPDSAVTAEITTPDGNVIHARTAEIDSQGSWKLDESILISLDAQFGQYSAVVTDGRETVQKNWTVESNKIVSISPSSLRFEPGDTLIFNGTAKPSTPIEMVLEDPRGKEVFSDIIQTNSTGFVNFEFHTRQSTPKGTYTLIATQEKETEFVFVGLGQLPTIPIKIEFDRVNYHGVNEAIISFTGTGSDVVNLLILDPSDQPVEDATTIITLQPDGKGTYFLDLRGYTSGVYTAVANKGSAQSSEFFGVGLVTGSPNININTTKNEYRPGEPILILGETATENVLLSVTLIDPDGNEVKTKETFSDKEKKISEKSFRIPSHGAPGTWTIHAKSGLNFHTVDIEVLAALSEGMQLSVTDGSSGMRNETQIDIRITGVHQTPKIEVFTKDGLSIGTLTANPTGNGEINVPWSFPMDTAPGTYTIKATNGSDSAETTYELKG